MLREVGGRWAAARWSPGSGMVPARRLRRSLCGACGCVSARRIGAGAAWAPGERDPSGLGRATSRRRTPMRLTRTGAGCSMTRIVVLGATMRRATTVVPPRHHRHRRGNGAGDRDDRARSPRQAWLRQRRCHARNHPRLEGRGPAQEAPCSRAIAVQCAAQAKRQLDLGKRAPSQPPAQQGDLGSARRTGGEVGLR